MPRPVKLIKIKLITYKIPAQLRSHNPPFEANRF
jgi:hypothetical protein